VWSWPVSAAMERPLANAKITTIAVMKDFMAGLDWCSGGMALEHWHRRRPRKKTSVKAFTHFIIFSALHSTRRGGADHPVAHGRHLVDLLASL